MMYVAFGRAFFRENHPKTSLSFAKVKILNKLNKILKMKVGTKY